MSEYRLDLDHIQEVARRPDELFACIELHFEQGPTLKEQGLITGVVTGISWANEIQHRWREIGAWRGIRVDTEIVHEAPSIFYGQHSRKHVATALPLVTRGGIFFVRYTGEIGYNPDESVSPADADATPRVLLDVIQSFQVET